MSRIFSQSLRFPHSLKKNKKNYKKALRHLDPIVMGLDDEEWRCIVNALRMTAGMPLVGSKEKL